MTTRPAPEEVAEDAGLVDLRGRSIDQLEAERVSLAEQIRQLQNQKGIVEQELWRRALEARPEVEMAGTAVLAGEGVELTVGASREWGWDEAELLKLQGAKDPHGKPLLTEGEYSQLVTWVAKVDGRYYNTLLRRGGFVAEALEKCRTLKSARPTFAAKERK